MAEAERSAALAKLARGLRLVAKAEAELREAEERERESSTVKKAEPRPVSEFDRARARQALAKVGLL